MFGLHTDLYQLTMAAGYCAAGKAKDIATFELFVRRLPPHREILVCAGLPQAVEYLLDLSYTSEEIDYLRGQPQFAYTPPEFWDYLSEFRFTGDVDAVPEGTPFFPNQPVMRVRAPLIEAQIPETYLLSIISFQTLIASKAARVVEAAAGRPVIEFGTRRAHSPEAGVLAGRASYLAGCSGTSNVEAGFRYGIPVYGTSAHSWVLAFPDERESYRHLQTLLRERTVYLIDTFDTVAGARKAAELGPPIWGVRLDSGDLSALAGEVRQALDEAGLHEAKIMVSGDLNEYRMREMMAAGAPVDVFGVGTELATSSDAPNLSAVYKMVQMESGGETRYTFKHSAEKATMPGPKQVFRHADFDEICTVWEKRPGAEELLRPVIREGALVDSLPEAQQVREHCLKQLERVRPGRKVEWSHELRTLAERERKRLEQVIA